MNFEPLVSVVIVTWNRKEELLKAVKSVYKQTYKNIEIVIVDNHSSDGTFEYIKTLNSDIKIIRTHKNLGCPPARNIGFANCSGEIIFSLDDDGWLDEKCIENIVKCFKESKEKVAVIACNIITIDENNSSHQISKINNNYECKSTSLFIGCAFAIKREIIEKISYFPDYFRQTEETYLALRILDKGYKILFNPNSIMYHKPSPKGRVKKEILFYEFKHDVENIKRLLPGRYALIVILWKLYSHLRNHARNGYILNYFLNFIKVLPVIFKRYKDEKINWNTFKYFRSIRDGK